MPLFNPPLEIQDHGVNKGEAEIINFTGSVTASVSGTTATVNVTGSGSTSVTQVEVNFGSTPTRSKTFTIIDASVTASSHIVSVQSGTAPTGKSADENEMDPIIFSAVPGSGQFILIASSLNGPVVGKYKANYIVG